MNRQRIRACVLSSLLVALILANSIIVFAATKKPVKLEIITYPKTISYTVGDELVTRGLSLRVTYDDSSSTVISKGYTTSYDFSSTGNKTVTINYSESSVSLKTEYQVTVYDKTMLETENIDINPDSYFELPVNITGNCGFMGIDINVSYDADILTPMSVIKGELITDGLFDDSVATAAAGSFDVIWSGSSEITSAGQLCTIKFYCNKNAEAGKTSVSISTVRKNTYKENYNTIAFSDAVSEVNVIEKTQPVEKKNLSDLVVEMIGWDVSESKSSPKLSGNSGNGIVTYTYAQIDEMQYTSSVPSKAGTYIVKASVEETDEYNAGVATCVFTITDKNSDPKPIVKKALSNLSVVMNGWDVSDTKSTPVITGNDGNGKVTYSYASVGENEYTSNIPSKAGTYIIRALVEETELYSAGVATCIFTITDKGSEPVPVEKKPLSDLTLVMAGWDVNETKSEPMLSGNLGNGNVTYTYAQIDENTFTSEIPSKPGKYIIKAEVAETEFYKSGIATCVFTITNIDKPIVRINATKQTVKYEKGSTLDLSDLVVEAEYNGGLYKKVTDYTTNAASIDMNVIGEKILIITYSDQGTTKSTEIKINVVDKRDNHENHNKYSLVEEVPATCVKDGTKEYYICDDCGRMFEDNAGKKEIEKPVVIPKTGHAYVNVVTKATLNNNGYTVKQCTKCKDETDKTVIYRPKTIDLSKGTFSYTGKNQKPDVVIKDENGKIISKTNFDIAYDKNCKTIGKHKVKVTFKGNYTGSIEKYYTIIPASTKIKGLTNTSSGIKLTWNKAQCDGYKIYRSINGKGLKLVKSITKLSTVSWIDSSAKTNGYKYTYVVCPYKKVNGEVYKSSMKEIKRCTYISVEKITGIKNQSSGKMSVKWIKNTKATGYQVQYSTRKSFSSAVMKTYRKKNVVSASYGKLRKGTTYYVRVRAYNKGTSTVYGAWSSVKKIKIAK